MLITAIAFTVTVFIIGSINLAAWLAANDDFWGY